MRPDEQQGKGNIARFFTQYRQISWVALVATLAWGTFGYMKMPKRKDPDIPLRVAAAVVTWPGASAEKIEQLLTRPVEETIAGNPKIDKITSNTRTSTALVIIELQKSVEDPGKQFDDIKLKLDSLTNLPQGVQPLDQIGAPGPRPLRQLLLEQGLDRGQGRGGHQRVATEGRTVGSR